MCGWQKMVPPPPILRSGMPAIVLKALNVDFQELAGCDLNEAAAHACLVNSEPMHFFKTIESMLGKRAFCHVHADNCPTVGKDYNTDIVIAGYPCNRNSEMNNQRFQATADGGAVGNEHSDVLLDVIRLIRTTQCKVFVLENVTGILKKMSGSSETADQSVLEWVHQKLRQGLKDTYIFLDFVVDSVPLRLDCKSILRTCCCGFMCFG